MPNERSGTTRFVRPIAIPHEAGRGMTPIYMTTCANERRCVSPAHNRVVAYRESERVGWPELPKPVTEGPMYERVRALTYKVGSCRLWLGPVTRQTGSPFFPAKEDAPSIVLVRHYVTRTRAREGVYPVFRQTCGNKHCVSHSHNQVSVWRSST